MKSILVMNKVVSCVKLIKRSLKSSVHIPTLKNQLEHESQNILVMAGAGLSTASGIPDFRSPESGIYSNLEKYNLPFPEAIFDLDFFNENPRPFLDLAKSIYPGTGSVKPNMGHYFIRLLELKGKLLRMYTQNIDGLERLAGISGDKLVEAHGSFSTASCVSCKAEKDAQVVKNEIMSGKIPTCEACKALVKPDIVFFGEMLPERFSQLADIDIRQTDFLFVIGTSLAVHPFSGLINLVPDYVPRLLINREVVGSFGRGGQDFVRIGDIVEEIKDLVTDLGWKEDLEELMKSS